MIADAVESPQRCSDRQWIAKFTGRLGSGVGVQQKEALKHLPKLPWYCSSKSSLPVANAIGRVSAYVHATG